MPEANDARVDRVAAALCKEWGYGWDPCTDCSSPENEQEETECNGMAADEPGTFVFCLGPVARDSYCAGTDETPTRDDFRRLAKAAIQAISAPSVEERAPFIVEDGE